MVPLPLAGGAEHLPQPDLGEVDLVILGEWVREHSQGGKGKPAAASDLP